MRITSRCPATLPPALLPSNSHLRANRCACVLLATKPFIAISEYQIALFLSNQPKVNLGHMPIALFDHTGHAVSKLQIYVPSPSLDLNSSMGSEFLRSNQSEIEPVTPTTASA